MTKKEILALRCAHADLVGVLQAYAQVDLFAINISAIQLTLLDIEAVLPKNAEVTAWGEIDAKD